MFNQEFGCTKCPYAGHIELKECPDAYTEVSKYCSLYNHEFIRKGITNEKTDKVENTETAKK